MSYNPQNIDEPHTIAAPAAATGVAGEYRRAQANMTRLDMMRTQVARVRATDPANRTPADLALLTEAPKVADRAIAELLDFTRRGTPGVETRQAAAPAPAAVPFPGPLAARCGRLTLEGLHAAYAVISGTAQAATVPEGEPKPLSALAVAAAGVRADVIACAAGPFTRQALDDTGTRPRLEDIARRAVSAELDRQLLAALWTDADVPEVAAPGPAEAVRLAAFELQAAGHTGLVLAGPPAMLAAIGPGGLPADLGVTAVHGPGLVVADIGAAAGLATRGAVEVYVSNTVGDSFVRNRLYLLAEVPARPVVIDAAAARRVAAEPDSE